MNTSTRRLRSAALTVAVVLSTCVFAQEVSSRALFVEELTSGALTANLLADPATRAFVVYLPPAYDAGEPAYPVAYALHGFAVNQWMMLDFVRVLDRMIRSGDAPEMIVAMPDASNAYGGASL
jgi:enterochelin esterase-like enzyme